MKNRLFLSLAALAISATAMAQQPEAGTISIIPRVGLNMSTLPDDIFVMGGSTNIPLEARYRTTFMGGVDVDYQFAPNFSATLGAYYAQHGCNYKSGMVQNNAASGTSTSGTGYSDLSTQLNYINIPLTLNAYIAPGLALKAGVQMGIALSGKLKYTTTEYTKNNEGEFAPTQPEETSLKLDNMMKSVCFSIPVGLSYEFANVIIDARYHFGLTPVQQIDGIKGPKNRVFSISAGYRFAL